MNKIYDFKLDFTYEGKKNRVLKSVSGVALKGKVIVITGTSGCGKTTLINIISGLIKPTSGEVVFDGKKVDSSNSSMYGCKGFCRDVLRYNSNRITWLFFERFDHGV